MDLDLEIASNTTGFQSLEDNQLHVYLRLKPGQLFEDMYEISKQTFITKIPQGSYSSRNIRDGNIIGNKYLFSHIFGPNATQEDLFNYIVKPKLVKFINGHNSCLLTHGISGAGKTFTIVGTEDEPGIIPRSLEYLFSTCPIQTTVLPIKPLPNGTFERLTNRQFEVETQFCYDIRHSKLDNVDLLAHTKTYRSMQQRLSSDLPSSAENLENKLFGIWVSFAEIYNEHIYDLLVLDPPRGKQRPKLSLGNYKGYAYIKNLTSVKVACGLEAYEILQCGIHNLNYAATNVNSHSSRSHSIFTIKLINCIVDADKRESVQISYFNFCDLAGSERCKKTLNVGERLKESGNINTSLSVLGRCIVSIRNSQKCTDNRLAPFRESKLTMLFQRALSGLEDISMIVNVNPCRDMFDENQHVLKFSAKAKDIFIEAAAPKRVMKETRFSVYLQNGLESKLCNANKNKKIEQLQDEILALELETEQRIHEGHQILSECIREHHDKYNNKETIIKADFEKLLEETIDNCRRNNEEELDGIRAIYEEEIPEDSRFSDVIEISSDEDDEISSLESDNKKYQNDIQEHHRTIAAMEKEIMRLKLEKQAKEQLVMRKKKTLLHKQKIIENSQTEITPLEGRTVLEEQNAELIKTLEDAKTDYLYLREQYQENEYQLQENLILMQELYKRIEQLELELEKKNEVIECFENSFGPVLDTPKSPVSCSSEECDDRDHDIEPRVELRNEEMKVRLNGNSLGEVREDNIEDNSNLANLTFKALDTSSSNGEQNNDD